MGKKKSIYYFRNLFSIVGYVMLWFLIHSRQTLYVLFFALPFFSFGIGSLFTLMMSMTADVIDLDETQHGAKRREGIFWCHLLVDGKNLDWPLPDWQVAAILSIVGFDADLPSQSEGALLGLRAFLLRLAHHWNSYCSSGDAEIRCD
jgi:GPH family glycoside/pentoside/hexuronide:cation symporter